MKRMIPAAFVTVAVCTLLPFAACGEVVVACEHHDGSAATETFRFSAVPGPRQSAALGAVFKLLDRGYTDGYGVTGRFLLWLEKHVKPGIVVLLDQAMRTGAYTPLTGKQLTGKSIDELWLGYGENPAL